ncbi:MAG: (Fe-S)-binding protein [Clostridia bacterium]|nr:(Fe-S)-binding protein [Clostridia bacterium]
MSVLFASGCALRAYKPRLVRQMADFLLSTGLADGEYTPCCKAPEPIEDGTTLIFCCPGCAQHFGERFPSVKIVSLWQVLLDADFPFPDYHGQRMTIHDACPARGRRSAEMQESARALCAKMNISLTEPSLTRDDTPCCGGSAPDPETRRQMALARAKELPEENVVVYCTGCVRSFSVTGVRPRHLLDLLYNEPTEGLTIKA